eukprot:403342040
MQEIHEVMSIRLKLVHDLQKSSSEQNLEQVGLKLISSIQGIIDKIEARFVNKQLHNEVTVIRNQCPYLYSVVIDTLLILQLNIVFLEQFQFRFQNNEGFKKQHNIYRKKLNWLVSLTIAKLHLLLNQQTQASKIFNDLKSNLQKHYKDRLEELTKEVQTKQTFTNQKMSSLPYISVNKQFGRSYNIGLILNECKFNSFEEQFCQFITMIHSDDLKAQQKLVQHYFCETQTRPEFIYNLIVLYYKRQKTKKVLHLIEQFLLRDDDLYRQSKLPSVYLIKLKISMNHHRDFQKGIEICEYLVHALYDSEASNLNLSVRDYLNLDVPKKKAYYYYVVGQTYSMYSDTDECKLYGKRKMMKQRAIDFLKRSLRHDDKNPYCLFQTALVLADLYKVQSTIKYVDLCLKISDNNDLAIILKSLMLATHSDINTSYNVIVQQIKKRHQSPLHLQVLLQLSKQNSNFQIKYRSLIERMHHENREIQQNLFNADSTTTELVSQYFPQKRIDQSGGDNQSSSSPKKQDLQSLNQSMDINLENQNQNPDRESKSFLTLQKLIHSLKEQPNEVKVLINDIAVPANSILDYQEVLIYTVKQYLRYGQYQKANHLFNDTLTQLGQVNPKVRALEAQLLYLDQSQAFKQQAIDIIKSIIKFSQQTDVEAMVFYSQILMENGKYDKAFYFLNHCLKFDYRNTLIWQLLGEIYETKASQLSEGRTQHYSSQNNERAFNLEKAGFCFAKAAKYENQIPTEIVNLIKMIPKYII